MKKSINFKKIFIAILLIVLVIGVVFLINTYRKCLIIKDLQEKISQYTTSTNYFVQRKSECTGELVILSYYERDNNSLLKQELEYYDNGMITQYLITSAYNDGKSINVFNDSSVDGKTVDINSENEFYFKFNISNCLETDSDFKTFLDCFLVNISEKEYNGKDCYAIKNFRGDNFFNNETVYIEKSTGLIVFIEDGNTTLTYEYEFDEVDDSVFVEPNIDEYTIL